MTGKVFVSDEELYSDLYHTYVVLENRKIDEDLGIDAFTFDEAQTAFERLAKEKLNTFFPTDEPMKLNEVVVDMDSYRS